MVACQILLTTEDVNQTGGKKMLSREQDEKSVRFSALK